jgi:polygalacturonase
MRAGRRELLLGGAAAGAGLALGGCATTAATASDPWRRADRIVAAIERPRIAARFALITDHGAKSGWGHDSRPAILAAMAALGRSGGQLRLPPGEWRCDGPIHLRSGIDLHLEAGAHLRFSTEPAHYLPVVFTRWEGTECFNYSPPIYALDAQDVAITGRGTIDGQGAAGFFKWRARQRDDQMRLRQMGAEGTPLADRVFGAGHYLRPSFVQFVNCQRVLIDGPRFVDSTFWMIHPVYCRQVTVRNVTLESLHLNSDGVDPDSSTDVLVEGCRFTVGDDGVAIKAGRDQDGWRVGKPSRRIVVRDCVYSGSAGGGMSIGSEMSGGVHEVFVERYTMGDVVHGLYLKSNLDRGGAITEVFARGLRIDTAQSVIAFTTDYHGYRGGQHPTIMRDIHIADVTCRQAIVGLSLVGADGAPLQDVHLQRIAIGSARTPLRARNAEGLRFEDVVVNGRLLAPQRDTGPETFTDQLRS